MPRYFTSFFCLCLLVMSAGCAKNDNESPPVQEMEINVDFRQVHMCSRISPEITVAYAPSGTKFYDIRLVEKSAKERLLGGGTWPEDGTGLIPEGALSQYYSGPCPPKDKLTEYIYIVNAFAKENAQPLATRYYRFTPEY